MILIPTIILCVLFVSLASVHVYWVLGGTWGWETSIPTREGEPLFEPTRFQTLWVALALLAAAVVAFWRGVVPDFGPI